ncbi:histidinol-phosphate transaminase [Neolewinella lacunae]|uniref:Histidinol-phosphate aminotransferase family protein n=1 Tax=Neolewinella lacunae TaxID=1517758 RepID=A0A923PQT7_9BACT|nr:histidinol-phosphate transaminase [Neolewinella lacunae]MBC6995794.1 histidinol-phosphate aminotransferase family protein [Neolewinella lacunae]MDN3636513.1 histidinol-phosphate transaminase [Neolewinella lacunae]
MTPSLSRRTWLRKAALAGAGLAAAPTIALNASPGLVAPNSVREIMPSLQWEKAHVAALPQLKARLLANENPWGPSPNARLAIMEAAKGGNRYQHEASAQLKTMVAKFEGVSEDHILLAPGSSDVLEKMAILHFMRGGNLVAADPAYMSLIVTAMSMQAEWKKVRLTDSWAHDLEGMAKAVDKDTKLVYICNPNNPTGTLTPADELRSFCRNIASEQTTVFVDEAYLEFLPNPKEQTMVPLIKEGKNVVVARTFSKVHGMAGLRIGYGVMLPGMVEKIEAIWRSNMSLCKTSVMGAMASMEDHDFQAKSIAATAAAREQTAAGLKKLGFHYVPSLTSFMIFPIAMEGKSFLDAMFAKGVGVRVFNVFGKDYCRVSMGTPEEMDLFLTALEEVLV